MDECRDGKMVWKSPVKKLLQLPTLLKELLKRKATLIFIVALLCIGLAIVFNAVFSKSYGIGCEDYCKSQPHVMCVGYWNISGQYPNCNCQFVCWGSKLCSSNYDCVTGERCYKSYEGNMQVGDLICHKLCRVGADCPAITPYCRLVNITIGSSSDLVNMCMMEECAKDADCPQPKCIGMRSACDSGICSVVDLRGLPAKC